MQMKKPPMKSFERSLRAVVRPALAKKGFVFDKKRQFWLGKIGSSTAIRFRLTENRYHGNFMVYLIIDNKTHALTELRLNPVSRVVLRWLGDRNPWWKEYFLPGIKLWKVHVDPEQMDASMREVLFDLENHWLPWMEKKLATPPDQPL